MEYETTISRTEAAAWLSQLARAFTSGNDAEIPFGPGTVRLHVPGSVRAEVEVEVEDEKVEVEIEFSWPLPERAAGPVAVPRGAKAAKAASSHRELANGAGPRAHAGRAKRR